MKRCCQAATRFFLTGVLLTFLFDACSVHENRSAAGLHHRSFIAYWPPPKGSQQLDLAIKDDIDMKGVITTDGSEYVAKTSSPASQDAECLAIARRRNVLIVGKTNLSELAVAPSGLNEYFGTPHNPYDKALGIIPGGSSSGSAAAVASGIADVAFGTDTAGSIRLPAAYCGIVGLKTTFGLIPLRGVFPVEPSHLDTVGPMGKDVAHVVLGMDLLQTGFAARYAKAVAAKPSAKQIKIGRLYLSGTDPQIDKAIDDALTKAGFQVVLLDRTFKSEWDQAQKDGNTVAAAGAWISKQQFLSKWGVRARTKAIILLGRLLYPGRYRRALERRPEWERALHHVFQTVDFIALPTVQARPPAIPWLWFGKRALLEARVLNVQNTVAVNFAGNPALVVPVPLRHESFPVTSLQLVGPKFSEAELLNAGRLVEAGVEKSKSVGPGQRTSQLPRTILNSINSPQRGSGQSSRGNLARERAAWTDNLCSS